MVCTQESLSSALEIVERFALDEELYHLLFDDESALEEWTVRWLENGWVDGDGRPMNHGVLWRDGAEVRLVPRWQSMLLGLEMGHRRQAGEL